MKNTINVSKSVFIVDVEEDYNVDPHFEVYVRETEPFANDSFCSAYKCYEDAVDYAVEQATELNELINEKQIDSYESEC